MLDEPGRGADITGAIDGLRVVIASDDGARGSGFVDIDAGGTLARAGFGGAFDSTEGRDVSGFGGALDGRHIAGFDGALAGAAERAVTGGALGVAEGPQTGGLDGRLVAAGDDTDFDGVVDTAGSCDGDPDVGVLDAAGGGDDAGFAVAPALGATPAGTASLVAPFTGMLWDSGASSQPESIASSSEFARLSVPCGLPSAPFAMSLTVPEPLAAWQLRTAPSYVATHSVFSEPRHAFLGT